MKEVSKHGVRTLTEAESETYRDPPGQIGFTQRVFERLSHGDRIPIPRGVYRFKTHAEMNKQWDDAMDEMVRLRQHRLHAASTADGRFTEHGWQKVGEEHDRGAGTAPQERFINTVIGRLIRAVRPKPKKDPNDTT